MERQRHTEIKEVEYSMIRYGSTTNPESCFAPRFTAPLVGSPLKTDDPYTKHA
jgi:hypothetical protein